MQIEVEKEFLISIDKPSVFVLILKPKKDYEILGATCSEWVSDATKGFSSAVVEYDGSDIATFAKKYTNDASYIVVLSGALPLLTSGAFSGLVDYCLFKNVNACKFWGGAVFNTKYLRTTNNVFYDSIYSQNEEDFYVVENATQRNHAFEILRNRIIEFHMQNGVDIKNCKNVVIEKYVDIEPNTTILGGNTLKGYTKIEKGVILKENNIVADSRIGASSCVAESVIEGSDIGKDCIIMPYSHIEKCTLGNNVVVSGNTSLSGRKIKDNRKI